MAKIGHEPPFVDERRKRSIDQFEMSPTTLTRTDKNKSG
jgi:hypothetical protein